MIVDQISQLVVKPLQGFHLKDATKHMSNHEATEYHKTAITKATEFSVRYNRPEKEINNLLEKKNDQQIKENRRILRSIIETILFLAKQNISFRGHEDEGFPRNDAAAQGNFRELLMFRSSSGDEVIKNHLKTCSRNAMYMSPQIQNELIQICAEIVKKKILKELISSSAFYSILVDETSDVSGTEQLSFSVRFMSYEADNPVIREEFLGFTPITDLSGRGIAETVIQLIREHGLDVHKLRGKMRLT
ncbi:unnamed protein product [Didymodactylos carnosus]|uniref:DUF4371 domain-containing protein n=1 Tax=Didymodactylos carnosus TaxID=1234261 RepID=A0A8S2QYH3_9BILA|nr:unnamed protein product [Didymodactylos carnosus]CAF4120708.1 unnamed protein product [Didymodactylos carnosus]